MMNNLFGALKTILLSVSILFIFSSSDSSEGPALCTDPIILPNDPPSCPAGRFLTQQEIPTRNACGSENGWNFPDNPLGFEFTDACNAHDQCLSLIHI